MRRLFALFLLVALPLSWTASAVAAYCKHEVVASEQSHLGHHDHQHDAQGGGGNTSAPADPAQSGGIDTDCGVCHASCVGVFGGAAHLPWIATAASGFADYREMLGRSPLERPERPQWRVLA